MTSGAALTAWLLHHVQMSAAERLELLTLSDVEQAQRLRAIMKDR